ncbi:iron-sulfur cluster assembly accessory protein Isa2 [Penicillium lagena]|nr:iron-sulfur cluster assembly accessory protein Isa2 [Penicillium lagena]
MVSSITAAKLLTQAGTNRATLINILNEESSTCDHRVWRTGLPVRSAVLKPHAASPRNHRPNHLPLRHHKDNPYHHLRITVTSGGCHGFQYMMSLESANKIDAEEGTIIKGEEDVATTDAAGGEAKVVMDEPSLEFSHV